VYVEEQVMTKKFKEYWDTTGYRKALLHVGKVFNNITVIEILKERNKYKQLMAICTCGVCGDNTPLRLSKVVSGYTKSCGCNRSLNAKSFVGKTFNHLTILEPIGVVNGVNTVLCQCSCGVKKKLGLSSVIKGGTRSCGHLKAAADPSQYIDNTYGRLTVTGTAGVIGHATCMFCACDCGSSTTVKLTHILSGFVKSCGCAGKVQSPEKYIGKLFGKLTVSSVITDPSGMGRAVVSCTCSCGATKTVRVSNLLAGHIVSCGCGKRTASGLTTIGGGKYYDIWRSMMKRCYQSGSYVTDVPHLKFLTSDKLVNGYQNYGARGITVCNEWFDPVVFVKWYRENIQSGETMDRIDNDKNYCPGNIRSADNVTQANNQRTRDPGVTGYTGIYPYGDSYGWVVRHNNKSVRKSGYVAIQEAIIERNIHIIKNNLPNKLNTLKEKYAVTVHVESDNVRMWRICLTAADGSDYQSHLHSLDPDKSILSRIVASLTKT